jgi:hypothetical protein
VYPKTGDGRMSRNRLMLIAGLIAISTALFVAGVIIERNTVAAENPAVHQEVASAGSGTGGEVAATAATPASGESGESSAALQGEATHNESAQATATKVSVTAVGAQESTGQVAASVGGETHSETVLGINMENPWIVGGIAVGWLVLLASLFLFGRVALGVVAVAAMASTIFDIAEVAYQVGRSNAFVAFIAVLVAAGHVAIAILAVLALMRSNAQVAAQPV